MSNSDIYQEQTHGVVIAVSPEYLPDHSDPDEGRHVWAYHVRIENHGNTPVQLLYRHWRIADAKGASHEVIGDGVVGEKPVLRPGDSYQYSSGTPLETSSGFMAGIFQVVDSVGNRFAVKVPTFSLDQPGARGAVH